MSAGCGAMRTDPSRGGDGRGHDPRAEQLDPGGVRDADARQREELRVCGDRWHQEQVVELALHLHGSGLRYILGLSCDSMRHRVSVSAVQSLLIYMDKHPPSPEPEPG